MHHKNIKVIVKKQLKKDHPDWQFSIGITVSTWQSS